MVSSNIGGGGNGRNNSWLCMMVIMQAKTLIREVIMLVELVPKILGEILRMMTWKIVILYMENLRLRHRILLSKVLFIFVIRWL